jgi:hypothetical protein
MIGLLRLFLCFALLGCGTNIRLKSLDEPCTRCDQCASEVCQGGVCAPPPDGGVDGGSDCGT